MCLGLWAPGARCGHLGLVEPAEDPSWFSCCGAGSAHSAISALFSVAKEAWSPLFCVVVSVGLLSVETSPAFCWRLCCVFAEGTGMVKHPEAAEKLRFVLLDSGTFCE